MSTTEPGSEQRFEPCPFCGSDDIDSEADGVSVILVHYYCSDCGARSGRHKFGGEAAKAWNTRHQPLLAQKDATILALKEQVEHAQQCWERLCDDETKLQKQLTQLQAHNKQLLGALEKIQNMELRADSSRGFVDYPHEKALRSACKISREALDLDQTKEKKG